MIDLLVAGAGPAGAATAIRAALAGLSVVVVEPRSAPIDKACGEGIAHSAVAYLDAAWGASWTGAPFHGIRYLDGRHMRRRPLPRRTRPRSTPYDAAAALLSPASSSRCPGRAMTESVAITQNATSVTAAGTTARYLAAADGLHSPIRRQLDLERREFRLRCVAGCGSISRSRPGRDLVEVYWSSLGEAYVTPVADDLVGVAVLTSARGSFDSHLEAFPALKRRLAWSGGSDRRDGRRAAPAARTRPGRRPGPAGRRRRRLRRRAHRRRDRRRVAHLRRTRRLHRAPTAQRTMRQPGAGSPGNAALLTAIVALGPQQLVARSPHRPRRGCDSPASTAPSSTGWPRQVSWKRA